MSNFDKVPWQPSLRGHRQAAAFYLLLTAIAPGPITGEELVGLINKSYKRPDLDRFGFDFVHWAGNTLWWALNQLWAGGELIVRREPPARPAEYWLTSTIEYWLASTIELSLKGRAELYAVTRHRWEGLPDPIEREPTVAADAANPYPRLLVNFAHEGARLRAVQTDAERVEIEECASDALGNDSWSRYAGLDEMSCAALIALQDQRRDS